MSIYENLTINTDGACKGNPGPGGWGVVLSIPGQADEQFCGGLGDTTNNIMELTAMLNGLRLVNILGTDVKHAVLRTDSQYVIKGLTEWMPGWVKKGWKTAKGDPVKNKELWVALKAEYDKCKSKIDIEYVKGHSGDPGNEAADAAANEGVARLGEPQLSFMGQVQVWRVTQ